MTYTCNITDSGNTRQTGNFQFCFRLISDFLFPPLLILCFMLESYALYRAVHSQIHSIERLLCHVKYSFCLSYSSDNWQVETDFLWLSGSYFSPWGGWGECGDLALRLAHSYAVGRDWSKKNSSSSWSSVTWHQAELRGQVERTSVQGMTQVRSPSLSCCFIVAEAPPVGQPDLFTSSLQSDTFLPPDNSTQFTFWPAFDLRQFGNSENWRYWALKVIDQSNISVNYLYLSWMRFWCDFHVTHIIMKYMWLKVNQVKDQDRVKKRC